MFYIIAGPCREEGLGGAGRVPAVAGHEPQARVTVAPRAARRDGLKGRAAEAVVRAAERAYPPLLRELWARAVFPTFRKHKLCYRGGGLFPTLAGGRRGADSRRPGSQSAWCASSLLAL
jgi:hypothetical protein